MQLTKRIGCLLALVFATASAFAADWFTANLSAVTDTALAPWSAAPAGWELVEGSTYKFNDWSEEGGLTYTAASAAVTSSSNSIIKTTVQFTAMDKADFFVNDAPQAAPTGAKAGLTIVEDSDATPPSTNFYGIVSGAWVELTGNPADALENPVEVKVEITKGETANYVKYTVGSLDLVPTSGAPMVVVAENYEIQSVSYKGCVPALSRLEAFAYGNTAAAKEEVVITESIEGVPPTIDYNPADLADRDVDVTNPEAVKTYLTGAQANGYLGWVNTTLGLDDTQTVAVASSTCTTKGSVNVDFGFIEDGNSTVRYVVDGGAEQESATIGTETSGIKVVTVKVTQNDTTVELNSVQVGVMNTGKELTTEEKTEKGSEKIFDIVAVPFEAFSGKVTVSNVLNTVELTAGDKLYVLRGGKYDTYELRNGAWDVVGGITYSRGDAGTNDTPAADVAELTAGEAIWIERSVNSKIVFTGKGETTGDHIWTWQSGEYSLVANPTVKEFSLYGQTFGTDGDMIIIEDVANPKQFEKKNNVWGEWKQVGTGVTIRGKEVTQLVFYPAIEGDTNEVKIPAGIGFWYYNAKGNAVTIDFGNNATPVAY